MQTNKTLAPNPPSLPASLPVYVISRNGVRNAGGVERVVGLLIDDFERQGIEVKLVDEKTVMPLTVDFGRLGQFIFPLVVSVWLWMKRLSGSEFFTISNSAFTPFFPADVVIVHGSAAGYVKALAQSGKRFIGMRLLSKLEALTMRSAKRVACVSDAVRDLCISLHNVAPQKCLVVYNGIDPSIFHALPKFKSNVVRMGFAGRLEYGKGLPYLIEIARWVSNQANVSLLIATLNEPPAELQGLSNIRIMRDVSPSDMSQFYDNIDIFLLPSLFEGFELVTLEALASGVSVLGTQVGACKVFLQQGVPWVRELPPASKDFGQEAQQLFEELRRNSKPEAMKNFIAETFSTQRFCEKIRCALASTIRK